MSAASRPETALESIGKNAPAARDTHTTHSSLPQMTGLGIPSDMKLHGSEHDAAIYAAAAAAAAGAAGVLARTQSSKCHTTQHDSRV